MRLARKVYDPSLSADDKAEHARLVERIRELKKEIAATEKQARVERKRPIELKRLLEPLKAELRLCEGSEAVLRGRLTEQGRAVESLKRRQFE